MNLPSLPPGEIPLIDGPVARNRQRPYRGAALNCQSDRHKTVFHGVQTRSYGFPLSEAGAGKAQIAGMEVPGLLRHQP